MSGLSWVHRHSGRHALTSPRPEPLAGAISKRNACTACQAASFLYTLVHLLIVYMSHAAGQPRSGVCIFLTRQHAGTGSELTWRRI
jgi:hypothetical protein